MLTANAHLEIKGCFPNDRQQSLHDLKTVHNDRSAGLTIAAIIRKPGHTNVCPFHPIALSYGNLAMQMSVFYPIARSYGNLAMQMSVFYPIVQSRNRNVTLFHMIAVQSFETFLSDLERPIDGDNMETIL